jgi:hypothetical protein
MSGVCATDWSWGALITDLDNDGLKDIFVANGIYQDLTNEDYIQYISDEKFYMDRHCITRVVIVQKMAGCKSCIAGAGRRSV